IIQLPTRDSLTACTGTLHPARKPLAPAPTAVGLCEPNVSPFWQLASPRLRQLDQRFDANQTSLVILEPECSLLPMHHERIHALAEEHNVLAVLDRKSTRLNSSH